MYHRRVSRELRDPIHGFIYRTSLEQEIMDTSVFQRLRRIKQLALASLVYPGAVHTRFEHSLGVMHLAGKIGERLLSDEEVPLVRLAGLLHDLGHGPFSHVSEELLDQFYDREKVQVPEGTQPHELVTWQIIRCNEELREKLSDRDREAIIGLLSGTWGDRLLKDIVSGPLDADKQDYLLRDSYYCGVRYGIYDLDRLLQTLEVLDDGDERVLAISEDGVHALEQFVLAKYYMNTQVYRHKVRLITDSMLIRAIELGIVEDKLDYLTRLYKYDGTEDFIAEWLEWDDQRLVVTICSKGTPDGYCKMLFHNLLARRLHKRIFSQNIRDFADPLVKLHLSEKFSKVAKAIETRVGEQLGLDLKLVIANKYTIRSVREQSRNSVGPILVVKPGVKVTFEEESTLFRSINEAEKDEFIEVYAPVKFKDEKDKRIKLREYAQVISTIICDILQGENGEVDLSDGSGIFSSDVRRCGRENAGEDPNPEASLFPR